jgi:serine/threonine-protein phosphatase 6 regulatory ankyrin repeat subunit B
MWSTNDINKIKILLQQGADINIKAKSGNTALLVASVGYGKYDIIKLLLDHGANAKVLNNKKENALMRAALFGDTSTISLLLSKGLDINAQDNDGLTALINSIFNVNRLVTVQLLDRGADPDLVAAFSLTAVSAAVTYNDTESVIAILKKAKTIDAPDDGGRTSLMWAAYNEHDNVAIIQALLDKGANVNLKAKDGSTALSWALKKGNTATVALLKKAGAK